MIKQLSPTHTHIHLCSEQTQREQAITPSHKQNGLAYELVHNS